MPELESKPDQPATLELEPTEGDTVRQVAADVLETMFFTEAEVVACEHEWLREAPCAHIRFEGSHSGEMLLAVSKEAADPIAGAFLGIDIEELNDAQRGQVIEELANILCGAMLSHLWPESKLALAPPELTFWQDWAPAEKLHRCFVIPEGNLAVTIRLKCVAAQTVDG